MICHGMRDACHAVLIIVHGQLLYAVSALECLMSRRCWWVIRASSSAMRVCGSGNRHCPRLLLVLTSTCSKQLFVCVAAVIVHRVGFCVLGTAHMLVLVITLLYVSAV